MRGLFFRLISLVAMILVSACSTAQPVIQPTPDTPEISPTVERQVYPGPDYPGPDDSASAYPAPVEPQVTSPDYPGPEAAARPPAEPTPTQDATLGRVKGRLLENSRPAPNVILYLAEVVKDPSGTEMVVSYDRSTSPNTTTDEQGNFVFVNINPGRYGLILDIVVDAYFLHYPGGENKQILFSVEVDQETDLGKLDYDDLPLPPP